MYFLCLGGQAAASATSGADGQDVQAGPSDAGQSQDIAAEPEAELPTSPPTYSEKQLQPWWMRVSCVFSSEIKFTDSDDNG